MATYNKYTLCRVKYTKENVAKLHELGYTPHIHAYNADLTINVGAAKPMLLVSLDSAVYMPFKQTGNAPQHQPQVTINQLKQTLLINDEDVRATFINEVIRKLK